MTTRRDRCKWCRVQQLVPLVAQTFCCQMCRLVNQNNGHTVPAMSQYNRYGYTAFGNSYYQQPLPQESTHPPVFGNSYYQQVSPPPPVYSNEYYQQPLQTPTPQVSPPPSVYGRKRAVLCGISYKDQKNSLKGSVNSVRSMKSLLVGKMQFPDASVLVLTEEESQPSQAPTKHNIQMALRWLVQGCQSGDSLVFYYSGHGSRTRDLDGDEIDGYDESLCPVDYKTVGKIIDDEINATIVRPLPRGTKLHAIIDTCFSGTVLDLQYMCRMNREGSYLWQDHCTQYATYKGAIGGIAVCLSACDDHQYSADTTAFTGNATGALTYSFIKTVENEPTLTYGRLLNSIRNKISQVQKGLGLNDPSQEPQLSSSEKIDIHSRWFRL